MSRKNVYVTPYSPSSSYPPVNPYPTSAPIIQPVYIPNVGSSKINRAVSVIAILLIIALLFVGMNFINGNGAFKKNVTWVRGYIDANGEPHEVKQIDAPIVGGLASVIIDVFNKSADSKGMFTSDAIPISGGVQINKVFETPYEYLILCFDKDDAYIGVFGEPRSSSEELKSDNFTGETFASTKYIRLYVYPKNGEEFTYRDWKRAQDKFSIYIGIL